jgi:hypothetical protein
MITADEYNTAKASSAPAFRHETPIELTDTASVKHQVPRAEIAQTP